MPSLAPSLAPSLVPSLVRCASRTALVAGLAGAALLLSTAPAAAHVTITASTTEAGETAAITLEVPHGCAGSATTEVAVRMPEGVGEVEAVDGVRWSADVSTDAVTFTTDRPVPDALRDEVSFSARLPDDAGAVLVFPVVQRCEEGESAWTEVADDTESRDELDQPAPVLVVTGPVSAATSGPDAGADATLMTYGAAGALAIGCVASAAVLLVRRRRG